MNTRKLRKAILTLCSALLLVSLSVGMTLAYLMDDATVTNTFTIGSVTITLDEATTVGEDSNWNGDVVLKDKTKITGEDAAAADFDSLTELNDEKADRGTGNKYKLMPGRTYVKDPTIHVDDKSENAWLFVKLENGIVDIVDATTIENQMIALGWSVLDETKGIYAYKETVEAGADVVIFEYFKVKDDADVSTYEAKEVKITGYAVQADGFDTAKEAWEATYGKQ